MSIVMPKELAAARFIAANKRPYLALALFALSPIERIGLKTMTCDNKYRLYYDPIIFTKWNREQVATVLIHQVSHILRKHHLRCEKINANAQLWNEATDAEINDDLLGEGLDLPENPITPTSLQVGIGNGRLAEEYYAALLKKQEQKPTSQSQKNQQGQSQQQPQKNQQPNEQHSQQEASSNKESQKPQNPVPKAQSQGTATSENVLDGDSKDNNTTIAPKNPDSKDEKFLDKKGGDKKEIPAPGHGKCGSCATGIREDYEADDSESPGLSSIEQLALEEKVAKQILKASQGRGRVSGGWARWANQKLKPKADWPKQLSSLISASMRMSNGANDYSYSRPNRRQSVYGNVVMPSLVQPIPNIVVIVDTSGSLNDLMMSQALAEIETIIKRNSQKLHLLSCDTRVHFNKKISNIKQVKLLGGGGTDMRVGIKEALEIKPKPDVIIVITDGYTLWPTKPPKGTKVIAALTCPNTVVSWIKQVKLFD